MTNFAILLFQKLAPRLSEDGALAEFSVVATENPSPVSVLDDRVYGDVCSLSPIKHISGSFKGSSFLCLIIGSTWQNKLTCLYIMSKLLIEKFFFPKLG